MVSENQSGAVQARPSNHDGWAEAYSTVGTWLAGQAPTAAPVVGVSTANRDCVYFVDEQRLAALIAAIDGAESARLREFAATIVDRARHARGGFLTWDWPEGPDELAPLLGSPDRVQLGGAMPQAAWALAALGARTRVALTDRSPSKLELFDPATGVIDRGRVVPIGELLESGLPAKLPSIVLEFVAGVRSGSVEISRTTRLVLLCEPCGIECDPEFDQAVRSGLLDAPRAAMISGLAFIDPADDDSFTWVLEHSRALRRAGVQLIHHELSEFPDRASRQRALDSVDANSVGVNLSELGHTGRVDEFAVALAEQAQADRVVVHADDWAMSVHRGDPAQERGALLAGSVLASARARDGRPSADLRLAADATFSSDIPEDASLPGGWQATVVPTPYLRTPAATIGLGDTFTGGLLLHASV